VKRGGPLKRTRMKRTPVERDWSRARSKVMREGCCRVCGRKAGKAKVEAAHVLGREHDAKREDGVREVHPDDVVPLCSAFDGDCHGKYDRHELDLFGYLTAAELERAVGLVGWGAAERRIRGRRS